MGHRRTLAFGALLLLVLCGAYLGFMSQASALDYQALYRSLALWAAVQSAFVVAYVWFVRHWSRWLALSVGALSLGSFVEFSWRVLSNAG